MSCNSQFAEAFVPDGTEGQSAGGPTDESLVVTHNISLVEPLRSLPEDDSNLATASASLVDRPIAALSSLQVGRSKSKEFVGSNH